MDIIAQILSILSCAGIILSFQLKNNRNLFLMQTIAAAGFGISYLLLGAVEGCLINCVAFINTFVLLKKEWRKKPFFIAICLGFAGIPILSAIFFTEVWTTAVIIKKSISIIIGIMSTLYAWATWKDDGKTIRTIRLFALTPCWLSYNIITFNIGGIICESFNIISIVVSFRRHGIDGFEK